MFLDYHFMCLFVSFLYLDSHFLYLDSHFLCLVAPFVNFVVEMLPGRSTGVVWPDSRFYCPEYLPCRQDWRLQTNAQTALGRIGRSGLLLAKLHGNVNGHRRTKPQTAGQCDRTFQTFYGVFDDGQPQSGSADAIVSRP